VQFYEHNNTYCLPFGSIVQGIFYNVIVWFFFWKLKIKH
jgi:hypothetical protein